MEKSLFPQSRKIKVEIKQILYTPYRWRKYILIQQILDSKNHL